MNIHLLFDVVFIILSLIACCHDIVFLEVPLYLLLSLAFISIAQSIQQSVAVVSFIAILSFVLVLCLFLLVCNFCVSCCRYCYKYWLINITKSTQLSYVSHEKIVDIDQRIIINCVKILNIFGMNVGDFVYLVSINWLLVNHWLASNSVYLCQYDYKLVIIFVIELMKLFFYTNALCIVFMIVRSFLLELVPKSMIFVCQWQSFVTDLIPMIPFIFVIVIIEALKMHG